MDRTIWKRTKKRQRETRTANKMYSKGSHHYTFSITKTYQLLMFIATSFPPTQITLLRIIISIALAPPRLGRRLKSSRVPGRKGGEEEKKVPNGKRLLTAAARWLRCNARAASHLNSGLVPLCSRHVVCAHPVFNLLRHRQESLFHIGGVLG